MSRTAAQRQDEHFRSLRAKAEKLLAAEGDAASLELQETHNLIEELRIYQAELEIQNEQLRQAQEQVEAARDRYAELYHKAPAGYATLTDSGLISEVNETLAEMLGIDRQALLNRPFAGFIYAEDRNIFLGRYKTIVKSNATTHLSLRLENPQTAFFVEIRLRSAPVDSRDEHSRRQVFLSLVDVHEKKVQEQQLRAADERFRIIVEEGLPIIFMTDRQGIFTLSEGAMLASLGLKPGAVVGSSLFELYQDYPQITAAARLALKGETSKDQISLEGPDGQVDFEIFYSPYRAGNKAEIAGVIGMALDITARKREERLRASQTNLVECLAQYSADQLLQKFIDEAEKLTGSRAGFFHFVEEDQEILSLQAWSTQTLANICQVDGAAGLHYPVSAAGVWVDCIRTRQPVIHNDYESLPHKQGLPEGHASIVRELVVPVLRNGKIKAILGVGNKPSDYNAWDISALQGLANFAWEAIEHAYAEESIKKQKLLLERSQELGRLGTWEFDFAKNALFWSAENCRILGVPADTVPTYEVFLATVHPDDRAAVHRMWQATLSGQAFDLEFRVMAGDRPKWVAGKAEVAFQAGKPSSVLGFTQDISEKKAAELELRHSRRRFEDIALSMGGWIWEIDINGAFTFSSGRSLEILGYTAVDFIGKTIFDFVAPEEVGSNRQFFAALIDHAAPFKNHETWLVHKSGDRVCVVISGVPVYSEFGVLVGYRGVNNDITEKKRMHELQLRTSQLSALGEVAAGVAHEINNPINGVINYAQLLLNKAPAASHEHTVLQRIIKEGDRIAGIVTSLLHFAQKDRKQKELVSIAAMITEPLNMMTRQFINDGISLDIDLGEDLPEVYGNPLQFEQVILNLFSNARHALNKRFPEDHVDKLLRIAAHTKEYNQQKCLQLIIYDQGCGIPEDHLQKIFNPFFTTKQAGVGTGLGLSVSSEILNAHNAWLSIESKVNQYTKAVITFPLEGEAHGGSS